MPLYYITETKPATMSWYFTVHAENEEEALRMVQDGECDPYDFSTEENDCVESSYEVEEDTTVDEE